MEKILQRFYTILKVEETVGSFLANIELNPEHIIYEGHFPEIPIVPGVCQMEMTRELLSDKLKKKLSISSVGNMKFLSIINPRVNRFLSVKIEYSIDESLAVKANSTIFHNGTIFFKFSGILK